MSQLKEKKMSGQPRHFADREEKKDVVGIGDMERGEALFMYYDATRSWMKLIRHRMSNTKNSHRFTPDRYKEGTSPTRQH